jgi:hypothetical protein
MNRFKVRGDKNIYVFNFIFRIKILIHLILISTNQFIKMTF